MACKDVDYILKYLEYLLKSKKRTMKTSNGGSHEFIYVQDLINCMNHISNEVKQEDKVMRLADFKAVKYEKE